MRSIAKNYLKLLIQDQIDTEDRIKDGAGLLNHLILFLSNLFSFYPIQANQTLGLPLLIIHCNLLLRFC